MTAKFQAVFGQGKPLIAMVHLRALPGSPLYNFEDGVEEIVEAAGRDLDALCTAGFDAVMFGNENDRPYEFAHSLDARPLADRARSAVFSSIPDAILVSGPITGEPAPMRDLESVKKALPDMPVLANTGVKHATVRDVLAIADGCIVGSALKVDGHTWNAVDAARAREFIAIAKGL